MFYIGFLGRILDSMKNLRKAIYRHKEAGKVEKQSDFTVLIHSLYSNSFREDSKYSSLKFYFAQHLMSLHS